ncbi:(E2-independent) E3 ubiquitin-conjugating enzyme FATS-like isoform X2 [Dunckerocampus dactyliophorus]|uniref:(E2-independent) E3 ubiquitin-conjugating enzyme FATS-like isoform X2 n=1 Tax=Dunckerocampus dactyliophorus TaxID=161453 RepID=UPI0024055F1F|nr:(E2-independent) E3 ubiquitin-conjugating enzyme FATS-like isoform X2 [Dunckerocampus dactyliophorus]
MCSWSLRRKSYFHCLVFTGFIVRSRATRAHSWTEEPRECPARPSAYLSHLNCLEDSPKSLSLKEALELFRPDFISRSQGRVRRMEQRARRRRRRALQVPGLGTGRGTPRKNCTTPDPLSDNLFKPRDRSISGREMQRRSRRMYNRLPEVEKKKQEEEKRAVSQANRLRADLFKKRLLEQILQR